MPKPLELRGVSAAGSGSRTRGGSATPQGNHTSAADHLVSAALGRTHCLTCGARLGRGANRYCPPCGMALWLRAPLPEGHPAGTVGADLFISRPSSEGAKPEEQLELGL